MKSSPWASGGHAYLLCAPWIHWCLEGLLTQSQDSLLGGLLTHLGPCLQLWAGGSRARLKMVSRIFSLTWSNGVAVEDLHWDPGLLALSGLDTAQDLVEWREEVRGEGSLEAQGLPAAAQGPLPEGLASLRVRLE